MKVDQIRIRNFRGLKEVEFKTDATCILVVGPNAVGKSTIFESIRLNKAFLFPNIQNEAIIVLNSLKAMTPDQQGLINGVLLNDPGKKLEISIDFSLSSSDIGLVKNTHLSKFIIRHLQNTNRFPTFREPFSEAQFLSSEHGKQVLEVGKSEIDAFLKSVESSKRVTSTLFIDQGTISGANLLDQEFLTILCESTGYSHSYFNYFPADRSLPYGDQPIQIGQANAGQQLQSYIANPQAKYQQIKQFIINAYLSSENSKAKIADAFKLIFDALLPGKSLAGVEINHNGNLSILIEDANKGSKYDVDSMSSGEKNLLLTMLFMELTTVDGGIILFDEPELHLNPAVQKKIISFIADKICKEKNRQIILCTHSPEMFATAFERDDCKIFHLISSTDISPIYKQDKAEVFGVLQKLGSSSTDLLSTKGVVYLEGPHDVDVLEQAISILLPGFVAKHLGGRNEIEKNIKTLQDEDRKQRLDSYQLFLFDLDNRPTSIQSTQKVKLLQWDRYCLENYLLESDAIFDTLKEHATAIEGLTRGSMLTKIKDIAFRQIPRTATREALQSIVTSEHFLRINDLICENPSQTIEKLKAALSLISTKSLETTSQENAELTSAIESKMSSMSDSWQSKWITHCDGKQVISEIFKEFKVQLSLLDFKKKILETSKINNYENWRLIESKLNELASGTS